MKKLKEGQQWKTSENSIYSYEIDSISSDGKYLAYSLATKNDEAIYGENTLVMSVKDFREQFPILYLDS
jgi:hypothetical protein